MPEMDMAQVTVERLQSTASFLFAADCRRTQLPFLVEHAEQFAGEFQAAEVGVRLEKRPTWILQQGQAAFNDRSVIVAQIAGAATELSVTVEGDTLTALDVLKDAWTALGGLAGEAEVELRDQGVFHYQTVAIVTLERTAIELFPALGVMIECAQAHLPGASSDLENAPRFRIELALQGPLGGANVTRRFGIERRYSATAKDRVFYTISPLKSDEHIEFLRKLVAASR